MSPIRLKRPGSPEPLSETAADWLLRVEEGLMSPKDESRFQEWIAVPEHAQAYENALWGLDALQRNAGATEIMALREAALSRRPEGMRRFGWTAGVAAVASACAGILLWVGAVQGPETHVSTGIASGGSPVEAVGGSGIYRSGVGERSAVLLPDGSVATLDTDSQLRVAYSASERGVYLLRGQALFEVAKNRALPFQVYAAGQRITAVGTTFNVRVDGDRVQVAMVEGVVKVRPLAASPQTGVPVRELTLRAGDGLVTELSGPSRVQPVDTGQVASWRGGLLVFEDEKLGDAVAEINRYTDRPIRLADRSVGEFRVTGVFKTNDPEHFATAMSEVFPIEIKQAADGSQTLYAQR
jgi:transmembrane sensor